MNKASCRIRHFILSYYKMHINLSMSFALMNNFRSALEWKNLTERDYDGAKRPWAICEIDNV